MVKLTDENIPTIDGCIGAHVVLTSPEGSVEINVTEDDIQQ
jgi:hypothetical protein